MDTLLEALPERPLTPVEAQNVCEHDAVEWGAAPAVTDSGAVYTVLLVFPDSAYGIGFEDEEDSWVVIHEADRQVTGAVAELDAEMDAWATSNYDDEMAAEIAPDLPEV